MKKHSDISSAGGRPRIRAFRKIMRAVAAVFLVCLLFAAEISALPPGGKYWVFFRDKDQSLLMRAAKDESFRRSLVSERALMRRKKTPGGGLIQSTDLPVSPRYLRELGSLGIHPVTVSRWLNAGSYYLTETQAETIKKLPFVKDVRRVARFSPPRPVPDGQLPAGTPRQSLEKDIPQFYGLSFTQNNSINAVAVHQAGITGREILIGMLDTGFNRKHESLKGAAVVAEYDFIHKDTTTSNEVGQDVFDQDSHGTATFSTIAGYKEEQLIGVAHDAVFALGKTEETSGETAVEEDFWVAGLEWLDSLGVDVVSSSLGYTTFDDVSYYTPADMDGNTAVTTVAADIAAAKGIVVVISAGNEGNGFWRIIDAPADGDSVIAVGAVFSGGAVADFSSRGPSADGRIKPDVCAQGVSVLSASSESFFGYSFLNGTSLSCPLVAGTAALILSAHPELTAAEVSDALKATASQSGSPDNTVGYGIIDAFAAVTYFGPAFSNLPDAELTPQGTRITTSIISQAGVDDATAVLEYSVGGSIFDTAPLLPSGGGNLYTAVIPPASSGTLIEFFVRARDLNGRETVFPAFLEQQYFTLIAGRTDVAIGEPARESVPAEYTLHDNFPNPFNETTIIRVGLKQDAVVSLTVYDILGRRVRVLKKGGMNAGTHTFTWDGRNDAGVSVSSGIYLYRLDVSGFSRTKKMVLVK